MGRAGDLERSRRSGGSARIGPAAPSRTLGAYAGVRWHHFPRGVSEVGAQPRVEGSRTPVQLDGQPVQGLLPWLRLLLRSQHHTYLDLDAGQDFDRQIIVKINIGDVLA